VSNDNYWKDEPMAFELEGFAGGPMGPPSHPWRRLWRYVALDPINKGSGNECECGIKNHFCPSPGKPGECLAALNPPL